MTSCFHCRILGTSDDDAAAVVAADSVAPSVPPVVATHDYIWVSMQSELICQSFTHCKKPSTTSLMLNASKTGQKNLQFSTADDYYLAKSSTGKPLARGVVGLVNLGNTCYMNSILQCLSNTNVLTDFFITNKYKEQLNVDNVLGHGGKIAQEYAKLMKDMWCDGFSRVVPRSFKAAIGEFQPQFADFSQQDSQELMLFLLDGLHEDLNRVKRKPYAPKIESCGRPDELIARESWRRFLLRNDSVVVDNCFGQSRSHVTCPVCGTESVTFEAYSCLSLPIPVKTAHHVSILVHLLPFGSPPVRVTLLVDISESAGEIKRKVANRLVACGKLPTDFILEPHHPSTIQHTQYKHHETYSKNNNNINDNYDQNAINNSINAAAANAVVLYDGPVNKNDTDTKNAVTTEEMDVMTDTNSGEAVATLATTATATTEEDPLFSKPAYDTRLQLSQPPTIVFQLAVQSPRDITKINRTIGDETPSSEFVRKESLLVMYQLWHPCPIKPTYMPRGKERDPAPTYVSYIDL